MSQKHINKIMDIMSSMCPDLEMAFFDPTGQLMVSRPDNLKHNLMKSSGIYVNEEHRFFSAVPIGSEGIFSLSGIERHPKDGEMFYIMSKHVIQLVRQQENTLNQISMQRDEISMLFNRLFGTIHEEDVSYIMLSAVNHGFHMMMDRVIFLLDFQTPGNSVQLPAEIITSVQTAIKSMPGITDQDLVGQLNNHQVVICKTFPDLKEQLIHEQCLPYLNNLRILLDKRCSIPVWIGVGNIVKDVREYSTGLTTAQNALKLARQFGSIQRICFIDDYLLEAEIARLPRSILDHFFRDYATIISKSSWMFETIEALIHNDMDQKATAESLYIHRNTLVFRLRQINEKLHLNPYESDSERFTLTALYIYMVLYFPEHQEKET